MTYAAAAARPPVSGGRRFLRFLGRVLLVVVGLFAAFVVWGLLNDRATHAGQARHADTMRPYFQAVSGGRLKEAYDRYTSDAYRARYTFEAFASAHKARRWNSPDKIKISPLSDAYGNLVSGVRIKYNDVLVPGSGGDPTILYDVIETAQGPRIEASYRQVVVQYQSSKSGQGSSQTELAAEPW
jgi:hypothetical protein